MAGDGVSCGACGARRREGARVGVGAGAGVFRLVWAFVRGMVWVLSRCERDATPESVPEVHQGRQPRRAGPYNPRGHLEQSFLTSSVNILLPRSPKRGRINKRDLGLFPGKQFHDSEDLNLRHLAMMDQRAQLSRNLRF